MPRINIISEEEIPQYQADGTVNVLVAVTYTADDRPPRTVWIDKAKYSDSILKQAIQADMERARAQAPRTLEI